MKDLTAIIIALGLFGCAAALSFHYGYGQRIEAIGSGTYAAKSVQVTNYVYTAKTVLEKK